MMESDDKEKIDESVNETRDVDSTTSSMDVPALNNLVVSMRPLGKQVKLHTINDLTRKAKKLKSKKGSDTQVASNNKKADRFLEEVSVLKTLDLDHTSKYALANTKGLKELAAETHLEERAKIRFSTHKKIINHVEDWRSKHSDWRALAAFILSKNTGRRFKQKKAADFKKENANTVDLEDFQEELRARRSGLEHGQIGDRLKTLANDEKQENASGDEGGSEDGGGSEDEGGSGDESVKGDEDSGECIGDRLKSIADIKSTAGKDSVKALQKLRDVIDENDDGEEEESSDDDDDDGGQFDGMIAEPSDESDMESGNQSDESDMEPGNQSDGNDMESGNQSNGSDIEGTGSPSEQIESDGDMSNKKDSDSDEESESNDEPTDNNPAIKNATKSSIKKEQTNKVPLKKIFQSAASVSSKSFGKPKVPKSKEMVVKRINLDNIDEELNSKPEDLTFLTDKLQPVKEKANKKKDSFFLGGESSEDEDEGDDNAGGSIGDRMKSIANIKPIAEKDSNYGDDISEEVSLEMKEEALGMMESAFVGQLSNKQPPKRKAAQDNSGFAKRRWEEKVNSRKPFPTDNPDNRGKRFPFPQGGRGGVDFRGRGGRGLGRGGFQGRGRGDFQQTQRGRGQSTRGSYSQSDSKTNPSAAASSASLHPSWDAARKRKEQQNKIPDFQGKKTTFDD